MNCLILQSNYFHHKRYNWCCLKKTNIKELANNITFCIPDGHVFIKIPGYWNAQVRWRCKIRSTFSVHSLHHYLLAFTTFVFLLVHWFAKLNSQSKWSLSPAESQHAQSGKKPPTVSNTPQKLSWQTLNDGPTSDPWLGVSMRYLSISLNFWNSLLQCKGIEDALKCCLGR